MTVGGKSAEGFLFFLATCPMRKNFDSVLRMFMGKRSKGLKLFHIISGNIQSSMLYGYSIHTTSYPRKKFPAQPVHTPHTYCDPSHATVVLHVGIYCYGTYEPLIL